MHGHGHQRALRRGGGGVVVDTTVEQPGVQVTGHDLGAGEQEAAEVDVGAQAQHVGAGQRRVESCQRLGAVGAVGDDLAEHGVVVTADDCSHPQTGVHADPAARRLLETEHRAAGGQEALGRVLGVDAGLDRVAREGDVLLAQRQLLARGDADLPVDQVHAGDHLGDRVLHLQAGVHLHEEELVRGVCGDNELDRPGADVPDRAGRVAGRLTDALAGGLVEQRAGRLLDDLLVAPLERALALSQVDDVAVGVGQDLHLDVAGGVHEPLEEQRVVAERVSRLAPRRVQGRRQVSRILDAPHALTAAAGGRLDENGVADLGRAGDQLVVGQSRPGDAGHGGHVASGHRGLGGDLVTHRLDRRGRRADEDQTRLLQRAGELRVLRQEAVPRVDGLRAGLAARGDDLVDVEVGLRRLRRAQPDRGVRHAHVQRVGVGIGVDGDRADTRGAE